MFKVDICRKKIRHEVKTLCKVKTQREKIRMRLIKTLDLK